jgi:hypothetical protein
VLAACMAPDSTPAPVGVGQHTMTTLIQPTPLGPPDTVLGMVRGMVAGDSSIWVLARGDLPLAIYSMEGTSRSYPLTRGTGPDQVRVVTSIESDTTDAVLIWEGTLRRIVQVTADGGVSILQSGDELHQDNSTPPFDALGGRSLQLTALETGLHAGMLAENFKGSGDYSRTTIARLEGSKVVPMHSFGALDRWLDSAAAGVRLYAPFPLWEKCNTRRVAVFDPLEGAVTIVDGEWQPIRTIAVGQGYQARTDSLARVLFFHRLLWATGGNLTSSQILERVWSGGPDDFAEAASVSPTYVNLICTADERVLLQRYEATLQRLPRASRWMVYGPDGTSSQLQFPENFTLLDATPDGLYGVMVDSLDVPTIAVARWP